MSSHLYTHLHSQVTFHDRYGLIIPNAKTSLFTKRNVVAARPSVFGNDSSSDEDAHKEVNAQIHREALKKKIQKQVCASICYVILMCDVGVCEMCVLCMIVDLVESNNEE